MEFSQQTPQSPEIRISKISRTKRCTDVVGTLQHMQKVIGARHFAVLRLIGQGVPSARRLSCTYSSWAANAGTEARLIVEAYGEALIAHLDASTLPVFWEGRDATCAVQSPDLRSFMRCLPDRCLATSGLAFPVRLGSNGNGYVVFMADHLEVASDTVLDMHLRAGQLMLDLLAADEKRIQPAEALNEREIACLQMAGDGCISEAIADKLGLSVHTVNAYLGTATTKLDAVNRIQAIAKAIRMGYIR